MKALLLGIIASLFFASTFVLNRAMELSGGSWVWSAALRYLFMLPPLLAIVLARGKLMDLLADMRRRPRSWIVWSTVGFGLFYAPICFAAAFGPAWLVASTWQITIIAGALLTPWIGPRRLRTADRPAIPLQSILISGIMLLGVLVVQLHQAGRVSSRELWLGVAPVAVAAVAYPLGNRKMMALVGDQLDTFQRVLGMTIASLPFWLIVAAYGLVSSGRPSASQTLQSLIVALCSGVIATVLFFKATDLARGDPRHLAAVEATQAGEVVFALVGEMALLHTALPSLSAWIGMALVVLGMILHSYVSHGPPVESSAPAPTAGA